jgi:hypothetical protein
MQSRVRGRFKWLKHLRAAIEASIEAIVKALSNRVLCKCIVSLVAVVICCWSERSISRGTCGRDRSTPAPRSIGNSLECILDCSYV